MKPDDYDERKLKQKEEQRSKLDEQSDKIALLYERMDNLLAWFRSMEERITALENWASGIVLPLPAPAPPSQQ